MRRTTVGLMILLAACSGQSQPRIPDVAWNEQRSLGEPRQVSLTSAPKLPNVKWNVEARGLSAPQLQAFPDLPEPRAIDKGVLPRITLTAERGLSSNTDRLEALTKTSPRVVKLRNAEGMRLHEKAPIRFPSDSN